MVDDKLAIPEALQKHWSLHGARMTKRVKYKGHDVFLADGGPHHDAKNWRVVKNEPGPGELLEEDKWMRDGYYVSVWGLQKGKAVLGYPCYFKIDHDLNLSKEARSDARANSALAEAKQAIDMMITAGLLEHYEGSILMVH